MAPASGKENRQWILNRRPVGDVRPDDFSLVVGGLPQLRDGDVLVRSLYFGYDASQRIWLTEDWRVHATDHARRTDALHGNR